MLNICHHRKIFINNEEIPLTVSGIEILHEIGMNQRVRFHSTHTHDSVITSYANYFLNNAHQPIVQVSLGFGEEFRTAEAKYIELVISGDTIRHTLEVTSSWIWTKRLSVDTRSWGLYLLLRHY